MWTGASVAAAKNVDFPTFGLPTTPNSIVRRNGLLAQEPWRRGGPGAANSVASSATSDEYQYDQEGADDGNCDLVELRCIYRWRGGGRDGNRRLNGRIRGRRKVADAGPVRGRKDHACPVRRRSNHERPLDVRFVFD